MALESIVAQYESFTSGLYHGQQAYAPKRSILVGEILKEREIPLGMYNYMVSNALTGAYIKQVTPADTIDENMVLVLIMQQPGG